MLDDLTASQLEDWRLWLHKFHPFPNRNDPFFAMLLSSWSEKGKPADFMIYERPEDKFDGDDITAEEFTSQIQSLIPRPISKPDRMPVIQGEKRGQ